MSKTDRLPSIRCLVFLAFVITGCGRSGTPGSSSESLALSAVDECPDKPCNGDTIGGYYKDFDFLALRGMCRMDEPPLDFPYAEVAYRGDSIWVKKMIGPTRSKVFQMKQLRKRAVWVQVLREPLLDDVAYRKVFESNPSYLTLLTYRGHPSPPHDWELIRVEVIYPGLFVIKGMPKLDWAFKPMDLKSQMDARNYASIEMVHYGFKKGIIEVEHRRLKGFGNYQSTQTYVFKKKNRCLPNSIFWIYFDLTSVAVEIR